MELQQFIVKVQKLKIDRAHGIAPHKPVLLLSILQAIDSNYITENKVYITPELVSLFKSNWTALVTTSHECRFALPFYHLTGDGFWKLHPKIGYENILSLKSAMRSFNQLNAAICYASFSDSLFEIFKEKRNSDILKEIILDTYFPTTKNNFSPSGNNYFGDLENKVVNEPAEEYVREIKTLKQTLTQESFEEEIFLRGGAFKREVPKIYNNTCCISGFRIDATINVSMIDACHIVPFSESYNDTISNGIALCPNLHRAFDRGIIAIDENYKVIVSKLFKEGTSNYGIRIFEGKQIILPQQKSNYPLLNNFEWHRTNTFKT
jgi:putative restriction endonuclease